MVPAATVRVFQLVFGGNLTTQPHIFGHAQIVALSQEGLRLSGSILRQPVVVELQRQQALCTSILSNSSCRSFVVSCWRERRREQTYLTTPFPLNDHLVHRADIDDIHCDSPRDSAGLFSLQLKLADSSTPFELPAVSTSGRGVEGVLYDLFVRNLELGHSPSSFTWSKYRCHPHLLVVGSMVHFRFLKK